VGRSEVSCTTHTDEHPSEETLPVLRQQQERIIRELGVRRPTIGERRCSQRNGHGTGPTNALRVLPNKSPGGSVTNHKDGSGTTLLRLQGNTSPSASSSLIVITFTLARSVQSQERTNDGGKGNFLGRAVATEGSSKHGATTLAGRGVTTEWTSRIPRRNDGRRRRRLAFRTRRRKVLMRRRWNRERRSPGDLQEGTTLFSQIVLHGFTETMNGILVRRGGTINTRNPATSDQALHKVAPGRTSTCLVADEAEKQLGMGP
jgi:hypothetical protein